MRTAVSLVSSIRQINPCRSPTLISLGGKKFSLFIILLFTWRQTVDSSSGSAHINSLKFWKHWTPKLCEWMIVSFERIESIMSLSSSLLSTNSYVYCMNCSMLWSISSGVINLLVLSPLAVNLASNSLYLDIECCSEIIISVSLARRFK